MKLDRSDMKILRALMRDGRASHREIATRTSLTTPTVSLRLSRMRKGGLVRGFEPIIDPAASERVLAFVKLRIPEKSVGQITAKLADFEEVKGIFVTSGPDNVTLKVVAEDKKRLERLVEEKLEMYPEGEVISRDVVTEVIKDVRNFNLKLGMTLRLRCDYCNKEILSDRPYNIRTGSNYSCFCSRSCRMSFLARHRQMAQNLPPFMGQG
ncbi:MAG: winged helix-turn-helix transcriptional regulator [Nitrososphaerota archaeon]|nr:winged helix-turn-helix transcriptional regulator [Nitrososphaerota archaeon]